LFPRAAQRFRESATTDMNAEPKQEQYATITLTDHAPVRVKSSVWPIVARATKERDHNNQELFVRHYLRVRQHNDGRAIVYGWMDDSHQGAEGAVAGEMVPKDGDIPAAIRHVAEHCHCENLIDRCVADLPAVALD
jgi:hypothetical protein